MQALRAAKSKQECNPCSQGPGAVPPTHPRRCVSRALELFQTRPNHIRPHHRRRSSAVGRVVRVGGAQATARAGGMAWHRTSSPNGCRAPNVPLWPGCLRFGSGLPNQRALVGKHAVGPKFRRILTETDPHLPVLQPPLNQHTGTARSG